MPSRKRKHRPLRRHYMKQWREFRELDQEDAAERMDISRTQLSKIENIRSPYSQRILEIAAEIYGCSVSDLLSHNPLAGSKPWSLQKRLQEAPDDKRRDIEAVVETMLKTGT